MKSLQSALLVGAVGALLSQGGAQPKTVQPVTQPPKQQFVMPFAKNLVRQKAAKASKKDAKGQKPLPKRSFAGMYPNHPALLSRGYLNHKRWKRNRRASAD